MKFDIKKTLLKSSAVVVGLHIVGSVAELFGMGGIAPSFQTLIAGGIILPLVTQLVVVSIAMKLGGWLFSKLGIDKKAQ